MRTIEHSPQTDITPSIATWDLKNEFNQLVAPGVYFYHVKSELGEKTGKFILIL
jgi:hypothetical protein